MSKTVIKDSITLISGRGLAFIISSVLPIVVVRLFSVSEFGEYRQALLIITTCAAILPLGMGNSLFYFFPRFPDQKAAYLSRTIFFILSTGLLLSFSIWIFAEDFAYFFKNQSFITYGKIVGWVAFLFALSSLIELVFIIDKKVALSSKILVATRLTRAIIVLTGAFQGSIPFILYGLFFLYLSKTIVSSIFFLKDYNISLKTFLCWEGGRQHFKYAMPLGASGFFVLLSEVTDKFLVSHFLGVEIFAVYMIGCYELPFIAVIFGSIGDIVLPSVVENIRKDSHTEVIQLWHGAIEKSMLIGIPIFMFFMMFANLIVPTLFTVNYAEAVPVFRIGLLAVLLESTRYGVITRAFARTGFMLKISIISYFIMVPLCYLGIMHFGILGAISAVIATKSLIVVSELLLSKCLLSLSWKNMLPFQVIIKIIWLTMLSLPLPFALSILLSNMNAWLLIAVIFSIFFLSLIFISNYLRFWRLSHLPLPTHVVKIMAFVFN